MIDEAEIQRRLGYHALQEGQRPLYEANRAKFIELALHISSYGPSREASLAFTALQEALMWTNAAIACNDIGVS